MLSVEKIKEQVKIFPIDDSETLEIEVVLGEFTKDRFLNTVQKPSYLALKASLGEDFKEIDRTSLLTEDGQYFSSDDKIIKNDRIDRININEKNYDFRITAYTNKKEELNDFPNDIISMQEETVLIYEKENHAIYLTESKVENRNSKFKISIRFSPHELDNMSSIIELVLKESRQTSEIYTTGEKQDVYFLINSGLGTPNFNPSMINIRRVPRTYNVSYEDVVYGGIVPYTNGVGYIASAKADGINVFLIVTKTGVFFVTITGVINKILNHEEHPLAGTVLQGELVPKENLREKLPGRYAFFIFDALRINDLTLVSNYSQRLLSIKNSVLDNFGKSLSRISYIELKDTFQINSRNFFNTNAEILFRKHAFEIDGIIYTPDLGYDLQLDESDKTDIHPRIFKWKPLDQLTIDFRISKHKNGISLLSSDGTIFKGSDKYPFNDKIHQNAVLNNAEDLAIIEFAFINEGFLATRLRPDKIVPNSRKLAISVWEDIHEPVTQKFMTGKTLKLLKQSLQDKKDTILNFYAQEEENNMLILGNNMFGLDIVNNDRYKNIFRVSPETIESPGIKNIKSDFYDRHQIHNELKKHKFNKKFNVILIDTSVGSVKLNKEIIKSLFKTILKFKSSSGVLIFLDLDPSKVKTITEHIGMKGKEPNPDSFSLKEGLSVNIEGDMFHIDAFQLNDTDESFYSNNIRELYKNLIRLKFKERNFEIEQRFSSLSVPFLTHIGEIILDMHSMFILK